MDRSVGTRLGGGGGRGGGAGGGEGRDGGGGAVAGGGSVFKINNVEGATRAGGGYNTIQHHYYNRTKVWKCIHKNCAVIAV